MALSPRFRNLTRKTGEQLQDVSRVTKKATSAVGGAIGDAKKAAPVLALPAPAKKLRQAERVAANSTRNAARKSAVVTDDVIQGGLSGFDQHRAARQQARYKKDPVQRAREMNEQGGFSGVPSRAVAKSYFDGGNAELAGNFKAGGGWQSVAGVAGRSALAGAGVGAVSSIAQGEDPWEGATKGAINFGAIGGAVKGSRMAVGAGNGAGFLQSAGGFNSRNRYSDSVRSLMSVGDANQSVVKNVLNNKG